MACAPFATIWKIAKNATIEFFSPGFGLYDKLRAAGLERRIHRLLAVEKMRDEEIASLREKYGNALIEIDRIQALHTGLMKEADRRYELLLDACDKELKARQRIIDALYTWYDRDGSVGGGANVFEDNREAASPTLPE